MKKAVVCGIGDIYRGDDGVGPEVVKRLESVLDNVMLLSGHNPNMFLKKILEYNPDVVILITASDRGLAPGSVEVLDADECRRMLDADRLTQRAMFVGYLQHSTGAEIAAVNMQPKTLKEGRVLSPVARNKINEIISRVQGLVM